MSAADGPPGSAPGDPLEVRAPAKVNVFLRVLGRRPDGYHDLETLIVPIDLADVLRVRAVAQDARGEPVCTLRVTGSPALVRGVPVDDTNLVLRAAAALAARTGARRSAEFTLEKRVPNAAGLGGGSGDAAAALRALNDLWRCGLGEDELASVGASVGSDVPAMLAGGPALVSGRGERVAPVPVGDLSWRILALPFGVAAADAYRWWDEDGAATGPDPGPVLAAAADGDPGRLGPLLFNDLEAPVVRRHPEIGEARDRLLEAGAAGAVMCGSGASVAALLPRDRSGFRADEVRAWRRDRFGGRA